MRVSLLPPNNVPVKVCNHRFGALATVSHCTDQLLSPSRFSAELSAFKHNIGITSFIGSIHGESDGAKEMLETGRWGFGTYFPTAYWHNGTSVTVIPDYNATAWTAAGVSAFSGALLGATKTTRYPNHGQQMFDISGGIYGYDSVTEQPGTNELQEITKLAEFANNVFKSQTGKNASVMSYQNGEYGCAPFILDYFLAGRSSIYTAASMGVDGRTTYGYDKYNEEYLGLPQISVTFEDRIKQAITTRYWDTWKPSGEGGKAGAKAFCAAQLNKTILNGGWYTDFIHYHQAYSDGTFDSVDDFFGFLNDTIGSNFVWRGGFEEAMEYMFLRESIETTVGYEKDGKVTVFMQVSDLLAGKYDKIQTPISIEVDLSSTSLSGKSIKCRSGTIRSIGGDLYIIETRLMNLIDGIYSFIIEESDTADYIDLSLPSATSDVTSNVLNITSSMPTKCVLFRQTGIHDFDCEVLFRSNDLSLTHEFEITGISDNLYAGVITEYKQSTLISI